MNRQTVLGMLIWSLTAGGALSILTGENRAISLRIWLAAFAIWFAWGVVQRLFTVAPLVPARLLGVTMTHRERSAEPTDWLREVRSLQGLLLRSRDNERAFNQQLRPRLMALAEHNLLLNLGINVTEEPARAAAALGDVAWLIDDREQGRAPTLDEVDRFIHLLMSNPRAGAEEAA